MQKPCQHNSSQLKPFNNEQANHKLVRLLTGNWCTQIIYLYDRLKEFGSLEALGKVYLQFS